ncbi:MAG: efflux RND transporter periplasmic adaptor subunit [Undibacterium sp.]|uniref:efflux RND transporter periplasmic adaptor subunit n=1 Tax=Undibacterium sp. TaxID=1914977 RepID=UPI002720E68C|nr:efflux RND transporter periplasmic adaptor subunit [Undibacterium sp.]MDO8653550.1 efflux RND transporter periplasmic adaptor subunit [Undibacterium sp.]
MNTPSTPGASKQDTDALALLEDPAKRSWWRRSIIWLVVALLLFIAIGIYFWQAQQQANAAPSFNTVEVSRGNLTLTVTANGTLQPTRSVSIGSELSGTVSRVLVDVNDQVKKGQVLVELDTAKLNDQIVRSRAAVAAADAAVALAAATVKETQSNLARLEEVSRLSNGKVPSRAELDTGRATLDRALANELSARANVVSAKATLSTDTTNLSKASIRSPIDGVILTRTVDPGNAVAASLQAVTLFIIAEDLQHLRLQVNVDEADVGSVKLGQKAHFTVSAYANRKYPATITRVAFGSTITDNVVTYITYLDVDNADQSLRPGMTATANIIANERRDVLLVPNTALRFTPSQTAKASANTGIVASLMPRGPSRTPRKSAASGASTALARQVWVLRNGTAVAVAVTPGISDGKMTEVTGGDLQAGMQVITDQHTVASK